jgi:hypothetical protein
MGMLSSGIFPKPREFQRMALVRSGHGRLADELDDRGVIFNHKSCERSIPFSGNFGNHDHISQSLMPAMSQRSFLPSFIQPRIVKIIMVKQASVIKQDEITDLLEPIAAMYDGIKKYASSLTLKDIQREALENSVIRKLVGLAAYLNLVEKAEGGGNKTVSSIPASEFEGVLQDTNFSGMMDKVGEDVASTMLEAFVLPGAYIDSATKQDAFSYGNDYINNDWMSKQASINNVMSQASSDINKILFNA